MQACKEDEVSLAVDTTQDIKTVVCKVVYFTPEMADAVLDQLSGLWRLDTHENRVASQLLTTFPNLKPKYPTLLHLL